MQSLYKGLVVRNPGAPTWTLEYMALTLANMPRRNPLGNMP